MSDVLVSILTPSQNQGRFLGDCLASVEAQTYRFLEHIVCDGGSTDTTLELLRRTAPPVRWVSEPDSGQANALNKAFRLSSGSIVGWLNSDDAFADRHAVATAVDAFERHPDVGVVFGHALLVNEENRVLQVHPALPFVHAAYLRMHYLIQPAVFFRRDVLEGEGGFVREDLQFVIDRELFIRLARRGVRFRRIGCVAAIDRHQRERKVLQPGFDEEARAFDRTLGANHRRLDRVVGRLLRIGVRLSALPLAARLPSVMDPALSLTVPSLSERIRLQMLTRRRDMGFS